MNRPEAVIFDLDGTLIHSAPDMQVSLNRALAEVGRGPLDLGTVTSFIGNGVERLVARSLAATGGDPEGIEASVVSEFLRDYADQKTVLTRPFPGVMGCLQALVAAGVPMGICTNKPQDPAIEMCAALGLSEFFPVIVGAVPGAAKKPDPAPLLGCVAALGARAESSLYVGDSAVDFETARRAGVGFRLFSGGYLNAPLPDLCDQDCFDDWAAVRFSG